MKRLLSVLLLIANAAFAQADLKSIVVQPDEILLDHKNDFQSITAQAVFSDGTTRDVLSEPFGRAANTYCIRLIPPTRRRTEADEIAALLSQMGRIGFFS